MSVCVSIWLHYEVCAYGHAMHIRAEGVATNLEKGLSLLQRRVYAISELGLKEALHRTVDLLECGVCGDECSKMN